jgi:hypothetical protein
MKSIALAAATALFTFALAPAHAQMSQPAPGSMYAGVSLSQVSYEESGRGTAKPTAIGLKLGKVVNQNFAIEGRFGTGLTDDDVGGGGAQDVSVDFVLGAYGKGILPLSPASRSTASPASPTATCPRAAADCASAAPTRISPTASAPTSSSAPPRRST